ncbi:MAG: PspC domain-containing protein [Acidobacteriaceae bacterium]|nr:PspC domain-containing protein [Acidobacteriaceae bacterium]MBV9780139.1 PspC domain-containing protein [Acidobacteriaceae bacterium]
MYCSSCGIELRNEFRYCPQCGTGKDALRSQTGQPARVLRRSRDDKKIAGVCSGIAHYLGIDVTLVRVLMICLTVWPVGVGLIIYVACWIVIPQEPLLLPPPRNESAAQHVTPATS